MRARDPPQVRAGVVGVSPEARRQAPGSDVHVQMLLRHLGGKRTTRPRRLRHVRQRHPEDVRELPRAVHRREGRRRGGQAPPLQEQRLPPSHPRLHVPRRGLHPRRRHRRRVHLRREVRRRELRHQALRSRRPLHGQRGTQHERIAVLRHHHQDRLARRPPRRVRQGPRGDGCGVQGRGGRLTERQALQGGRHHRLGRDRDVNLLPMESINCG
mmetsp:Transcript_9918/g.27625  ORF Transcript_9918/g.27625 Transcript_9918/m.27625 type:complete len:213 (+) Transcript_9918:279-917(+)